MIPAPVIKAWRKNADWPFDEQVEQDLIISSSLVALFNNDFIKDRVAFRGGTAIHKLLLPKALRYSEDIDLNRLDGGSVKPLLVEVRSALKDLLGTRRSVQTTKNSVKLIYSYKDISGGTRNLKIEINTRETLPQKALEKIPYSVESDFFTGATTLNVFDREEMIGTKIRSLYQRNKGRDLFDLFSANETGVNWENIVNSYKKLRVCVSPKEYLNNLDDKMADSSFTDDIKPLLPSHIKYDPLTAYQWFKEEIIPRL
jgi:predicted nucleotidyltransferase component of viral defense system